MLTDDDLTRELGAAFRDETADLTYRGRTRPSRAFTMAVPALTIVAVAGVAVGVEATHHHTPATHHPSVASNHHGVTNTSTHKVVTEKMKLAGFSFSIQHSAGQPNPVIAEMVQHGVPANARKIATPGTQAKAWIGKDPRTGDNALYVKAPTRNGGRLFALLSKTWSQRQLISLFRGGEPTTVPLVKNH